VKARRSGSAMRSTRSSVKPWSTDPSSWRAGALAVGREVEMERVVVVLKVAEEAVAAPMLELKAAVVLRSPADLNWAVAARAPIWLARRKAFIFLLLSTQQRLVKGESYR